MHSQLKKLGSAMCAGLLAVTFAGAAGAEDGSGEPFVPTNAATTGAELSLGPIQLHTSVHDDPGVYARGLYLAYIKGPNEATNSLAQRGLLKLAAEAYQRTSVEPAGIVGIDIENDDLSLFPFIYWPVSEKTPALSAEARAKIQNHTGRGNLIAVDLINGSTLTRSPVLQNLLNEMQVRPLETVEEGNVLTQSFYIVDGLSGTANRDVLVERTSEQMRESDMTSFIIGNQNWAGSWSGITVGPDVAEDGIRSGLNMLFVALTGNYKLDELHADTIEQKREFRRQNEERERQRDEANSGQLPAPKNPQP